MHTFLAFIVTIAFFALIIGLIKPSLVRMPSRKRVGMIYGGAWFLCFILFGITTPAANAPAVTQNSVIQTTAASTSSVTNPVPTPQTSEQKLQAAVQSDLPASWSIGDDYGDIDISSDTSSGDTIRPAGSQYVEIHIDAVDNDDNSFITQTGQLTTNIFQQAFQIDPTFYDVSVRYEGQVTDQYGNSTTSPLMVYTMDQPLYKQINWSGLSAVQNDIHMCAFLREQANETNAFADGRYIGCDVFPYDLRSAESSIETQNATQYPDIPQDGS